MKRELLDQMLAARESRQAVVRICALDGSRDELVWAGGSVSDDSASASAGSEGIDDELAGAIDDALRSDRAVLLERSSGALFVQPFNPPIRLAIVGAVHIAQRLAVVARDLGYAVTVIDPRRGFLTPARFPGVELDARWPDEALEAFAPDARSAVVTLSHDAKIDEPALGVALRAPCFYVGALGSRRTQERRRDRLREAGLSEAELSAIHGPVGLDLGARSPAEIALSIAAEMTATLRGRG